MPFPRDEVEELLAACHRRCCVCHRFCGVKIETDHMLPAAEGGPDTIDNAIPVCFECHAEVHSYNDKHPRGRKFRPNELRRHKEQWLEICRERPDIFVNAARTTDVGPLQALIDELEFNLMVAETSSAGGEGCLFYEEQFRRAIQAGAVATLQVDLKRLILEAYVFIGLANHITSGMMSQPKRSAARVEASEELGDVITRGKPKILAARDTLLRFLGSDD
jgi:hypothetical protein